MAGNSEPPPRDALDSELEAITAVLLGVARGDFSARAQRSYQGDSVDVLAYLVNATADEVSHLVAALEAERSELKQTRDQLVVTAKLAALGELAAGVAHELNQPLTAMRMLVDMLRMHPDKKVSECLSELDTMADAARRMGKIIEGVRSFGRPGPMNLAFTPPRLPLEAALQLLGDSLQREGVVVRTRIEEDLPVIWADGDRLSQVLLNLINNARDALRLSADGTPEISLTVEVGGAHIVYSVQDNGPGVREEHVQRLFDPFFSTKEVGEGTGLGLSVSHGIVKEHGGRLSYQPVVDGGARFQMEIPVP